MSLLLHIVQALRERGSKAISPGALTGSSGIEHPFGAVVETGDDGAHVVLDFASAKTGVGEVDVVRCFAKVFDVSPRKALLIVTPRLTDAARKLADFYRILVIEADDSESAVKKVLEIVAESSSNAVKTRRRRL